MKSSDAGLKIGDTTLKIRTITDGHSVTLATVTGVEHDGGHPFRPPFKEYTGTAKCDPNDRFEAVIGERIAVSRALRRLLADLEDGLDCIKPETEAAEPTKTLDELLDEAFKTLFSSSDA